MVKLNGKNVGEVFEGKIEDDFFFENVLIVRVCVILLNLSKNWGLVLFV